MSNQSQAPGQPQPRYKSGEPRPARATAVTSSQTPAGLQFTVPLLLAASVDSSGERLKHRRLVNGQTALHGVCVCTCVSNIMHVRALGGYVHVRNMPVCVPKRVNACECVC